MVGIVGTRQLGGQARARFLQHVSHLFRLRVRFHLPLDCQALLITSQRLQVEDNEVACK
jgi:hypothetical protein